MGGCFVADNPEVELACSKRLATDKLALQVLYFRMKLASIEHPRSPKEGYSRST